MPYRSSKSPVFGNAIRIAGVAVLIISPVSPAMAQDQRPEVRTATIPENVGQRQTKADAAEGFKITPTDRLETRINNRINSRVRNRIDENFTGQSSATDAIEQTERTVRRAVTPIPAPR